MMTMHMYIDMHVCAFVDHVLYERTVYCVLCVHDYSGTPVTVFQKCGQGRGEEGGGDEIHQPNK